MKIAFTGAGYIINIHAKAAKAQKDTELAAVITYTKNHWGNKTGQIVQPAEVAAARK